MAWLDFNGNVKMYINGTEDLSLYPYGNLPNADYNNDGIIDVILYKEVYNDYKSDYHFYIALSGPNGYSVQEAGFNKNMSGSIPVDFNRDGLLDIFTWEVSYPGGGSSTQYTPITYIQMADGTFMRHPLSVVTDESEMNGATFNSGGNGSFKLYYTNMSGMCGGKGDDVVKSGNQMQAIDINLDGYPDLIDPKGHSFLSLPDGRYYAASFAGNVVPADLNGDGISDLVIFDEPNKQVLLYMSNGTEFNMTQLIENGNISAMYCRDLNGDGLLDILLCMNTPKGGEYAYLAFFSNNGDGTFSRTVRAAKGEYEYKEPVDLNNNGRPSLIAILKTPSYEYKRIDWDKQFTLSEKNLFPNQYDNPISQNNIYLGFRDYDGDGQLEILAYIQTEGTCMYTPEAEQSNTAPQRMEAPRVITDSSNGLVKIEWADGVDKESATCDLTYHVRVNNADGTINLLGEYSGRQLIANAGTWSSGTKSACVRAVDPSGRTGEWSEPTSFENNMSNALFTMSFSKMATVDTLQVATISGTDADYKAEPDGIVEKTGNGRANITFATAGKKTITAQAPGGGSTTMKFEVNPLKTESLYERYHVDVKSGFDFNQSGTMEGIDYGKLYTFDKNGYSYYPSFSLSDVTINPIVITDYDMDGRPDIIGKNTKNGNPCPLLINDGDLEFKTMSNGFTDTDGNNIELGYYGKMADFDNDGLIDLITHNKLYRNIGNGKMQEVALPAMEENISSDNRYIVDLDRDGLTDIITEYNNPNKFGDEVFPLYILHNKGGMEFEPIMVSNKRLYICNVIDTDNDGYPELIQQKSLGYNNDRYIAYSIGQDLKSLKVTELPGLPLCTDFDNDGLCDYITYGDSLMLSSMGGKKMKTEQYIPFAFGSSGPSEAYDFNADGRPDYPNTLMLTCFKNTAPTAPTTVFANNTGRYVAVNWSGATDNETPSDRLRYNISIKKKGAKGAGSYIVSPLNATNSKAVTAPTGYNHYQYGTQREIPIDRFEAGTTYEICVQTIDPWNAHSLFSEVFEFTPQATTMISMAQKGGVDIAMPIQIYDNSGAEPVIDADGGKVNNRTITWDTPGLKTVKVTAGAATAEHKILIVDRPWLRITLPKRILAGQPLTVDMPKALIQNTGVKFNVWGSNGMDVQYDAQTNTATIKAENEGDYTLYVAYSDEIFISGMSEYAETKVVGAGFRPELTMVGVDATSGKNRVKWNADMTLPYAQMFSGNVVIYRETNIADNFEKLAEVPMTNGGYTDATSNPDIQSNRYMITLPTTYGMESLPSDIHGSIHLMVNRGLGNDINLHWTPYEGARISQYTILSGTSPDHLQPLESLSGNARSFTHRRTDDKATYYSIVYTLQSTAQAQSAYSSRRNEPRNESELGASNIICSKDAYDVTMAESIIISVRENTTTIGSSCQQLHLTATVMPVLATIGNVEWSITEGNNLAMIAPDGTLSILENTTGGNVTVCARAIDGSGVEATLSIKAESFATGIADNEILAKPTIRTGYREVVVEDIHGTADVTVINSGGSIIYRSSASSTLHIPLQPGFYIVKAGKATKKVVIR